MVITGSLTGACVSLQVLFVSDPALLPIMFDRALYPPNAHILDRPVEQFLVQIDAVRYSLILTRQRVVPACALHRSASKAHLTS